MDVKLHQSFADDTAAVDAADAIEACVHCGFCLATCPTYLDSRDERDSPRGRIYLVRELLEQGQSNARAQHHLDRCLGCRACETTCPSGVRYGMIADTGRSLMEQQIPRSTPQRLLRGLLRRIVPYPRRFAPLLRCGQMLRSLLPHRLRQHIPAYKPASSKAARPQNQTQHHRRVVLLEGCVQSVATPATNEAARHILDRLGIAVRPTPSQGCCGAIDAHLGYPEAGHEAMRRNIDAWWPAIESGAEAVLITATGCGAQVEEYAHALRHDPNYSAKAAHISSLAHDLSSFLLLQPLGSLHFKPVHARVAVQVPCSQSHALGAPDTVKQLLSACGYTLVTTVDDHLCCGSAGTYSLLQPSMAERLRARKLQALSKDQPDVIASANVGCQLHLAGASRTPVVHWSELYLEAIADE